MAMPTVTQIQTWRQGAVEQLHDRVYDRFTVAVATTEIDLFNTPISQTRQGAQLTLADTNIRSANIPSNENWALQGMGIRYQADEPRTDAEVQAIFDFLNDMVFTIRINGKDEILQITGDQFLGPLVAVQQPAATINSKIAMGDFFGYMKFAVPIGLVRQTTWTVEMEAITPAVAGLAGDKIRVYFDRELLRLS